MKLSVIKACLVTISVAAVVSMAASILTLRRPQYNYRVTTTPTELLYFTLNFYGERGWEAVKYDTSSEFGYRVMSNGVPAFIFRGYPEYDELKRQETKRREGSPTYIYQGHPLDERSIHKTHVIFQQVRMPFDRSLADDYITDAVDRDLYRQLLSKNKHLFDTNLNTSPKTDGKLKISQ